MSRMTQRDKQTGLRVLRPSVVKQRESNNASAGAGYPPGAPTIVDPGAPGAAEKPTPAASAAPPGLDSALSHCVIELSPGLQRRAAEQAFRLANLGQQQAKHLEAEGRRLLDRARAEAVAADQQVVGLCRDLGIDTQSLRYCRLSPDGTKLELTREIPTVQNKEANGGSDDGSGADRGGDRAVDAGGGNIPRPDAGSGPAAGAGGAPGPGARAGSGGAP